MRPKLSEFEGCWSIRRMIDHDAGQTATFTGEAQFVPDAQGLAYQEAGLLRLDEKTTMRAERRYFWRDSATDEIAVFFADGKPFHTIGASRLTDTHFCDPDTYHVQYWFAEWPDWRTVWRVQGPRKAYVMTSHFAPK